MLDAKPFGDAGPYERITGRAYFSVPIANIHNQRIVDLRNAVNLKNGEVEFSADFVALRPKDPRTANGSLLLEVPNRGRARILSVVDGGDWNAANDAGDGWMLRNGFTIVSLGWQWDAAGADALRLYAPIAKDNGKTITGLLRGDLMPSKEMQEIPLGHLITGSIGGIEYPTAAPDDPRNVLTVRDSRDAPRTLIPKAEWQFAQTVDGKLTPSDRSIHLAGGFHPGKIYEYVYVVADPVVAGLGFAAIRDFASYAKHAPDALTPAATSVSEKVFHKTDGSCAIFSMKASTLMRKEGSRSMACSHMSPEQGEAALTIASRSLRATRNPRRPSSSRPTSFHSPISLKRIR